MDDKKFRYQLRTEKVYDAWIEDTEKDEMVSWPEIIDLIHEYENYNEWFEKCLKENKRLRDKLNEIFKALKEKELTPEELREIAFRDYEDC